MSKFGLKYLLYKSIGARKKAAREVEEYYLNMTVEEYSSELEEWFKDATGEVFSTENPISLNQKIQWLKLFDSRPYKSILADKYEVRKYVKQKIGEKYLVELLGVWDSVNEFNIDILPNAFVLKCNHSSGMNYLISDKSKFDDTYFRTTFEKWLNTKFGLYSGELHYLGIRPRIIAEKYIGAEDEEKYDIRVFCFNGKPKYVQQVFELFTKKRVSFYDEKWNKTNINFKDTAEGEEVDRPAWLNEILELSKKLAEDIPLVRVDWMIRKNGEIYFSEMTMTPRAGFIRWENEEDNILLGKDIELPETKYTVKIKDLLPK